LRLIWKRAIALLIIAAVTGTATVFAVNVSSSCTIQSYGRISYTRQTFDFNHDGKVDIVDAAIIARAFGSRAQCDARERETVGVRYSV
jgi:hypothetical protein